MSPLKVGQILASQKHKRLNTGMEASELCSPPYSVRKGKKIEGKWAYIKSNGLANMTLFSSFPNPFINSVEIGFAFRLIMWL